MHAVAGVAIDAATRWMNSLYAIVRIGSLSDQTAPLDNRTFVQVWSAGLS
jgi:hypothetical protein